MTPSRKAVAVVTAKSGRTLMMNVCDAVLEAESVASTVKLMLAGPAVVIVPVILQKVTADVAGGSAENEIPNPPGSAPALMVQFVSVPEPPVVGIQMV